MGHPTSRSPWREDAYGRQARRDPWASHFEKMCTYPIWMDFDSRRVDMIDANDDELMVRHAQAGLLTARRPYMDEPNPDTGEWRLMEAIDRVKESKTTKAAIAAEQRRADKMSHLPEDLRDYMARMHYEGLTGDFANQVWPLAVAARVKTFGNSNTTYQVICAWRRGARADRKGDIERLVRFGISVYSPPPRSFLRPDGSVKTAPPMLSSSASAGRISLFPHPHWEAPDSSAGTAWGN